MLLNPQNIINEEYMKRRPNLIHTVKIGIELYQLKR